jgi:hypothetical protein
MTKENNNLMVYSTWFKEMSNLELQDAGRGLPMVLTKVNGIHTNPLVDSGPNSSFISQSFAKDLHLTITKSRLLRAGIKAETLGQVHVDLEVNSRNINVHFEVIDHHFRIIIGNNLF